jgi:hypothetical protein
MHSKEAKRSSKETAIFLEIDQMNTLYMFIYINSRWTAGVTGIYFFICFYFSSVAFGQKSSRAGTGSYSNVEYRRHFDFPSRIS